MNDYLCKLLNKYIQIAFYVFDSEVLLLEYEQTDESIKLPLEFGSTLSVIIFFNCGISDIKVQRAVEGIRHNVWTCVFLFLQKHPFGIGFFPIGL